MTNLERAVRTVGLADAKAHSVSSSPRSPAGEEVVITSTDNRRSVSVAWRAKAPLASRAQFRARLPRLEMPFHATPPRPV